MSTTINNLISNTVNVLDTLSIQGNPVETTESETINMQFQIIDAYFGNITNTTFDVLIEVTKNGSRVSLDFQV